MSQKLLSDPQNQAYWSLMDSWKKLAQNCKVSGRKLTAVTQQTTLLPAYM